MFNNVKELIKDDIILFPIRHHSPACSYHLKSIIEAFKPNCILIEGPSDCNDIIKYFIEKDTKPPFCIYSSYKKNNIIYRSYYPFLSYSPEYQAIKIGLENNIDVLFIDTPFSKLIDLENNKEREIYSLYDSDDYKFNINEYIKSIIKKTSLRSFNEFWERDFEINGIYKDSHKFIESVYTLGHYMRLIEKEDKENSYREYTMAHYILKAKEKYNKVLIIAGSFHIDGIIEKIEIIKKTNNILENNYDKKNISHYLIPYSFKDADQRSGYQSGIEFPYFYNEVWKKLEKSKNNKNVYNDTIKDFIIKISHLYKEHYNINIVDSINAYYMADSLSKIRGKKSIGVYELIDSIKNSFVKGLEINYGIYKILSGIKTGSISSTSIVPPVLIEFRELCKKFKIKTNKKEKIETILEILKDKNHYDKSIFFHKIKFINIKFCNIISATNYIKKENRNLAREIWQYEYSTNVEALLIEKSIYGISIDDIVIAIIKEKINNIKISNEISILIIEILLMNISYNIFTDIEYKKIENIIINDNNFESIFNCINNLIYAKNIIEFNLDYESNNKNSLKIINNIIEIAIKNIIDNIEKIKHIDEESISKISHNIKDIYQNILSNSEYIEYKKLFLKKINEITKNTFGSSHIYAICLSIQYKEKIITIEQFTNTILNFLQTLEDISYFISGILLISKDIIFINNEIINSIDKIIKNIDEDKFLKILPHLRYAFTNLTKSEISSLSQILLNIYNKNNKTIKLNKNDIDIIIKNKMIEYKIF